MRLELGERVIEDPSAEDLAAAIAAVEAGEHESLALVQSGEGTEQSTLLVGTEARLEHHREAGEVWWMAEGLRRRDCLERLRAGEESWWEGVRWYHRSVSGMFGPVRVVQVPRPGDTPTHR